MDNSPTICRIRLKILGGFSVIDSNRDIRIRGKKSRAVVAYLILSRKKQIERLKIASLLWEDSCLENANSSMRQVVKEIRSIAGNLNNLITFNFSDIKIMIDQIDIDTESIIENIKLGICLNDRDHVEKLFSDDLLSEFDGLAEAYQEWLSQYRADIRRRALRALNTAAGNSGLAWSSREEAAEVLVQIEPMNESAYRVLIEAAARRGDIGTALTRYERLYKALDEQMGTEPTPATQELIVRVKLGAVGVTEAAPSRLGTGEPVIAIFPFRNPLLDESQSRLGDLISEELICSVFALREIGVISSASIRSIQIEYADVQVAANKLGVDYYLVGTIVQHCDDFRLSAQLVRTLGGLVVWADTLNFRPYDLPAVQTKIARMITWQIVPSLRNTELRIASAYQIQHLTAYQLILRAQEAAYRLDPVSFRDAELLIGLAIEREPRFAAAHIARADWLSLCVGQGWSSDPARDAAEIARSVQTTLRLGGMNGRALALLGHNRAIYARAYDDALSLMAQALDLAPNDAETLMWSSPTYAYTGDNQRAISNALRAIELSPFDPLLFRYEHFASISHFSAGDYDLASKYGLRSYERNPNYTSNIRVTVAALMELGLASDARELARKVIALEPEFAVREFVKRQAFRDPSRRIAFGNNLVRAGLPA